MELSVVLVNHNGAGCLPQTLDALARCTATEDVECIVVDSGSTDGSWEGVEQWWDKVRALRFEQNVGFCVGCNRGAEAATGRLLAFVNFDGEVESGLGRAARRTARRRDRLDRDWAPSLRGRRDDSGGGARHCAEHRRCRPPGRQAARRRAAGSGRRRGRDGGADDGAEGGVSGPRRLLRGVLHVRGGGGLLPPRARTDRLPPRERHAARARARRRAYALEHAALLGLPQPPDQRGAPSGTGPARQVGRLLARRSTR